MDMALVIVSASVTSFILILLLLGPLGKNADLKARRISDAVRKVKVEKYEELEKSFYDRFFKPIISGILRRMAFLIPKNKRQDNKALEKALRYAGISLSVSEYTAVKTVVLLLSFLTAFMIAFGLVRDMGIRLLILTVGLLIGIVSPILFLRSKTEKRRTQIQHQLPEVMDILMVSVEAGLGLDEAISQMAGKMKGVIVDEFQMVLRETQMGKPRKEAFARLAECADIQELKVFVSAVIQAEQLGIPIKNVLAVQSASMRDMRRQIAQEKGMKAPVKMIIPMVVFILPVLIIILMAQVSIQLMEQFK